MSARAAAAAYVEAVNAHDPDALGALFASTGRLVHPIGLYEGIDAIGGFYRDLVFAGQVVLETGRLLADDDDHVAVLELVGSSPLDDHAHRVHTIDVFDVDPNTGLISTLTVYAR